MTGNDLIAWSEYCVDEITAWVCQRKDYVSNVSMANVIYGASKAIVNCAVIILVIYIAYKMLHAIILSIFDPKMR